MTHHQVIREEMQAAAKAVAELNESISKLTAQRDRIALFAEAMGSALTVINNVVPEQLEFELVDTPENVVEFKQ